MTAVGNGTDERSQRCKRLTRLPGQQMATAQGFAHWNVMKSISGKKESGSKIFGRKGKGIGTEGDGEKGMEREAEEAGESERTGSGR